MPLRTQLAAVLLAIFVVTPARASDIPPSPSRDGVGEFTHDFAGLLDKAAQNRIAEAQKRAFERHDTPIIVVTIASMSEYGHDGPIETLATEWFDTWQIGTLRGPGKANKGVLLLVSVRDRKACLELGGDWGRRWDGHCQNVLDGQLFPAFRLGNYGQGITACVDSMARMAAVGPAGPVHGTPTAPRAARGNHPMNGQRLVPLRFAVAPLLIGMCLIALGIRAPRLGLSRSWHPWRIAYGLVSVVSGTLAASAVGENGFFMAFFAFGVIFFGVFFLTFAFVLSKLPWDFGGSSSSRSSISTGGHGGGSFSGGGFSGGSSGGGGASGGW